MKEVPWSAVEEYVANAGAVDLRFCRDYQDVVLELLYGNGTTQEDADMVLRCVDCCYVEVRRVGGQEPGDSNVLEAYLRQESPLITALWEHRLDSRMGCLALEYDKKLRGSVQHLEIIGALTINLLFREIQCAFRSLTVLTDTGLHRFIY